MTEETFLTNNTDIEPQPIASHRKPQVQHPTNDEIFKKLVQENHMMLLRIAKSLVDVDLAEEVVQEAWISIYKNLPHFEGRSSLKTWISKITINKAISILRSNQNNDTIRIGDDVEIPDFYQRLNSEGMWSTPIKSWPENDPEKILTGKELQSCIESTISRLPEKQRASFYLNYFGDESREEICKQLNISASNIKVLIHRARIKVFEHINNFQETGEC